MVIEKDRMLTQLREALSDSSIYSRDPDGHIVELATEGPGFLVDETNETLGQSLKLPPWLEPRRGEIEPLLTPIQATEETV